ncbi:MAG: hypothetical protein RR983_19795, partial [Massilia sp.]
ESVADLASVGAKKPRIVTPTNPDRHTVARRRVAIWRRIHPNQCQCAPGQRSADHAQQEASCGRRARENTVLTKSLELREYRSTAAHGLRQQIAISELVGGRK